MNAARTLASGAALATFVAAGPGCLSTVHPLDQAGTVQIYSDVSGPLFAATPGGSTRQRYSENVTLELTEDGQPAHNAFVDVKVSSAALTLHATDDTCKFDGGFFRCSADAQGFAYFRVEAASNWSTTDPAKVEATWSDRSATLNVTVFPPGLPSNVTAFSLSVGGLAADQHVPPTFAPFSCTYKPADPQAPWSAKPRSRQVVVHAVAAAGDPDVLTNAPVVLQSPSTDVQFSTAPDCTQRSSQLTVLLDAAGSSSPAYACFSDLGGTVEIQAVSGEVAATASSKQQVIVDAEPYFLGVTAINPVAHVDQSNNLFQIEARDALGQRLALSVGVSAAGTGSISLSQATYKLADESADPTVVTAIPKTTGAVHLHVAPSLAPSLGCDSPDIDIQP